MEVLRAVEEIRDAFLSTYHGLRWYQAQEYIGTLQLPPAEALPQLEEAVREMTKKRSLDDAGYFALENERDEKILFYNLLRRAAEGMQDVPLSPDELVDFRAKVKNCSMESYGYHVEQLAKRICGETLHLPEGVRWDQFRF